MKILITGASGGFGSLTVHTLLKNGHQVAASMRGVAGKNEKIAKEMESAGAHIVEIDVTNDASVKSGVKNATEKLGGLDVLINNAGVGVLGLQEAFTVEDFKKVFDINVFGVQRITKEVLPHFRAQQSGLLVNISSLLGRMTVPFYGPYNATKWALEAMVENYRSELSGLGIDSVLIEPGGFPTTFMDNLFTPSDSNTLEQYGDYKNAPQQFFDGFEGALKSNPAQNPQLVADAVVHVIETPAGSRPFRTVVDNMGMGDPIKPYNEQLEQLTAGVYGAFGIGDSLILKTTETV